jgi:hypothetical protein
VTTEPRCPACGSLVRPGADWCSLCHADLRPAPERTPEPALVDVAPVEAAPVESHAVHAAPAGPLAVDAVQDEVSTAVGGPRRGRHARATVEEHASGASPADVALAQAGIDAGTVAAMLAADGSRPLASAADRIADRQHRLLAVVGGMAALTAVGFLVLYVFGSFVH